MEFGTDMKSVTAQFMEAPHRLPPPPTSCRYTGAALVTFGVCIHCGLSVSMTHQYVRWTQHNAVYRLMHCSIA
jgi:hypothetical protein